MRENGGGHIYVRRCDAFDVDFKTMPRKMLAEVGARYLVAFGGLAGDDDHLDLLCLFQQRQGVGDGARRGASSVPADHHAVKFRAAFLEALGPDKASQISISFHFFPEEREDGEFNGSANGALYPELSRQKPTRKVALGFKRAMDIAGSAFALIVLFPLLAIIALAIKATSKGPVLFSQERLGQYGKKFRFLKFRSMRKDCDSKIHQEYVTRFIAGQVSTAKGNRATPTFKIQKDPRITPVGSILRKTSLDELPQFWNVLMGDMSLVGPRPPLEYEFKKYDIWHRRRVLEIKPGITGLWQVHGRSRTQFDDMVRLDLKYARAWSLSLDLEILLRTPGAVISGDGAH